ncbi:MAG: outer membrane beta-barrel protein, partial [Saprospiraceae bacterium]|nr:outer membrane beta-barrel protein [Saprospiraceae bacterium]
MEKSIILILFSILFTPLFSQETGLKHVLGGQFNYSYVDGYKLEDNQSLPFDSYDNKTMSYEINPYTAVKVSNNVLIGLRLGYGAAKASNSQPVVSKSNKYSADLFTRYYFKPSAIVSLYVEPSLNYLVFKEENSYDFGENKRKATQFALSVSPGIAYHVSEKIGLIMRLGQLGFATGKNINETAAET